MSKQPKAPQASEEPETPQGKKWGFQLGALALIGALSWFWIIQPALIISEVEPRPGKRTAHIFPPPDLVKRIKAYQRAASSPFLRATAKSRLARVLTRYVNPSRIERTFRDLLQKGDLKGWQQTNTRWETLLRQLEALTPQYDLQAYRAYLYLQAGQWQRLHQWSKQIGTDPPKSRMQTLLHIWLGHGAFWSGDFVQAMRHYQTTEAVFQKHPAWEARSSTNWRLPAERSAVLYHIGLIRLLQGEPTKAQARFALVAKRWEDLRKNPAGSVDVAMAHCLAAEAAWQANDRRGFVDHMRAASRFKKDPVQAMMMRALAYSSDKANPQEQRIGRKLLLSLASKVRSHKHSYPDTQAIAKLYLIEALLRQNKSRGLKMLRQWAKVFRTRDLPPTLSTLLSRNTFPIRFVPAPPALLRRLLKALPQTEATNPVPSSGTPSPKPTASTKPAVKAANKPTSQPTSRPSVQATSQPSSQPLRVGPKRPPQAAKASIKQLRLELQVLLGLGYLRRAYQHKATQTLKAVLAQKPSTQGETKALTQAHLYLGMLALEARRYDEAAQHLGAFVKVYPGEPIGAFALAAALFHRQPQKAKALITPWKKERGWRRSFVHFFPPAKVRKAWKTLFPKAGFWWRMYGQNGLLSARDPFLTRRSLYWKNHNKYPAGLAPTLTDLFGSLRTSHLAGRFGLLTLMTKARLREQAIPFQAQNRAWYTRQRRALQKLYSRHERLSYILDNALYSHRVGTIAIGFF